jgi:DNA-binding response OmpR family regulator
MTRVLNIDADPQTRSAVAAVVKGMNFEFDEAEDGEQGIKRLRDGRYDLVIMDTKLTAGEGVELLPHMRALNDTTPVIVLTAVVTRSVVVSMMKLGISHYMLKPFDGTNLAIKIAKALGTPLLAPTASPLANSNNASHPRAPEIESFDVLVIDAIENVHTKLKALLPAQLMIATALDGEAALTEARSRLFRVILIDTELARGQLLSQLRVLQPTAILIALILRRANSSKKVEGFDGVVQKPFSSDELDEVVVPHCASKLQFVTCDATCLNIAEFTGPEKGLEKYFERVSLQASELLQRIAAACHDHAIVDLSKVPYRPDRLPRLIQTLQVAGADLGLTLRVVGSTEVKALLSSFDETTSIVVCASLSDARSRVA